MAESLKLVILDEDIDKAESRADPHADDLDSMAAFARATNIRIKDEQPELLKFIRKVSNSYKINSILTFAYAAALAYEMIPDNLRQVQLEPDHSAAAKQSIDEHLIKEVRGEEKVTSVDFIWFFEKFGQDTPFMDWLRGCVQSLDNRDDKKDFIFGSLTIIIPFCLRGDAKELEKLLIPQR